MNTFQAFTETEFIKNTYHSQTQINLLKNVQCIYTVQHKKMVRNAVVNTAGELMNLVLALNLLLTISVK